MITAAILKGMNATIRATAARYGWQITESDLADVAQDACVKVLESYNPERGEVGALATVAARTCAVDFLRNRGHKRIGAEDTSLVGRDDDSGEVVSLDLADHAPTPLQALIMARRDAAITRALANLSDAERDVLLSEATMTGAERIRRMRAIDKVQDEILVNA